MAYISTSELSARLGVTLYARLTDRVNGTDANQGVGLQIVEQAEAEANSYLAKRYATPVDLAAHPELDDILDERVLDLAEYLAWRGSPFVNDVPNRVKMLYEQARRWFADVAAGRINLPAGRPPASAVAEDDSPRFRASPRSFTAEELDGL